jgi:alkylation response protein AidB-like acyl-CoA dehydrogenase
VPRTALLGKEGEAFKGALRNIQIARCMAAVSAVGIAQAAIDASVRVTSSAIQIHGAYGLSEEFPVERYFRDARVYTVPDGTTEIQKLIIGREVLGVSAIG